VGSSELTGSSAGTRLRLLAPIFDSICLCAFVLLGRQSHGVDGGSDWFFIVVWPLVVGWFAAALAVRLYTSRSQAPWRVAATVVLGVTVGLLLRVLVTHRDTPVAFIIVAYGFIGLSTCGWRIIPSALSRMARRLT
jgi:FtsH-binding integral membrane protein